MTVIDPAKAEAEFVQAMAGARTPRQKQAALEAHFAREREKDIPMVEDLPLAPEEETPDFKHLTTTLRLRTVRAHEHWRGNTHLTFAAIIERLVSQGSAVGHVDEILLPHGWEVA